MDTPDYAELFQARMKALCVALTGSDDSPADLAAELRLKERNIQRYMSGKTQPLLREAVKVATRAGVSLDWLAGLSDDGGPAGPVPTEHAPAQDDPAAPRPRAPRADRRGNGSKNRRAK
jgi:transcriptional regulator with XRE-family HTH domain